MIEFDDDDHFVPFGLSAEIGDHRHDSLARRGPRSKGKAGPDRSAADNTTAQRFVVAGPIPQAADLGVEARLARYRGLNRPLPAPVPANRDILSDIEHSAPHATTVLRWVGEQLDLARLVGTRACVLPPVLIVGPPGSGKTWLAQRLAQVLFGHAHIVYPCAGMNSAVPLKGQTRSFHESGPGVVIELLARNAASGGCMVWDELDKTGTSNWNGSALDALIQLLEPATSCALHDDFLQATVDLSLVSHIATANRIDELPAPLLSRLIVLHLDRPPLDALDAIVGGLRLDLAKRMRVPPEAIPYLDGFSLARLKRAWRAAGDLRVLRREYEAEVRRVLTAAEERRARSGTTVD
jgi:hypothetical protein